MQGRGSTRGKISVIGNTEFLNMEIRQRGEEQENQKLTKDEHGLA